MTRAPRSQSDDAGPPDRAPGDEELDRSAREMLERVGRRGARIERHRREGDRSIWSNIGMSGLVGGTVMIFTLAGAFLGRYLDRRWGSGTVATLSLMMVGLALGCWGAWRLIAERRE